MQVCKVYKGLNTPCKIKGVFSKYFYIIFVVAMCAALFVAINFMSMVQGGSFAGFIIESCIPVLVVLGLYRYFYKKSNLPKMKFDNREVTLSNRVLYCSLNRKKNE